MKVFVCGLALAAGVIPAAAQSRVTSAASVRLRAEPSSSSVILRELPLGSELVDLGTAPGQAWHHVGTATGEVGWVATSLTRAFTSDSRLQVFESIVLARLARDGDGPPSWFQLVDFVERVAGELEDRELAARWAWLRLRALGAAARSLPLMYVTTQPHQDWVDAHAPLVRYFELGGYYGLDGAAVIHEHDRHAGTRAADDIMWLAARAGIGGECEGWVPCYVNAALMLDGEYLRRYPSGRHAAAAVQRIAEGATRWSREPYEMPPRDCPELLQSSQELRRIVAGTDTLATPEALGAIDRVRRRCGGRR